MNLKLKKSNIAIKIWGLNFDATTSLFTSPLLLFRSVWYGLGRPLFVGQACQTILGQSRLGWSSSAQFVNSFTGFFSRSVWVLIQSDKQEIPSFNLWTLSSNQNSRQISQVLFRQDQKQITHGRFSTGFKISFPTSLKISRFFKLTNWQDVKNAQIGQIFFRHKKQVSSYSNSHH